MSFIVCAIAMYGFWWNKPFGVERRHILLDLSGNGGASPAEPWHSLDSRVPEVVDSSGEGNREKMIDLLIDYEDSILVSLNRATLVLYLAGACFSSTHLVAWNWSFPTPLVQTLWRIFSVMAFVSSFFPLATLFAYILSIILACFFPCILSSDLFTSERPIHMIYTLFLILAAICFVGYVVARVTLLVLTFYCFASMPASVYERVDWTGFIPHFG